MLCHSRFKKRDKAKKENEIFEKLKADEPFVLIATQIVEISLDISFDILFSDNAPIDLLIQRFGRINRQKNSVNLGEIYIYKTANSMPYWEYILALTFEIIEDGIYSLDDLNRWLNLVYDKVFDHDKRFANKFYTNSKDGEKIFNKVLKEGAGILSNKTPYELKDIEIPTDEYLIYDDYIK